MGAQCLSSQCRLHTHCRPAQREVEQEAVGSQSQGRGGAGKVGRYLPPINWKFTLEQVIRPRGLRLENNKGKQWKESLPAPSSTSSLPQRQPFLCTLLDMFYSDTGKWVHTFSFLFSYSSFPCLLLFFISPAPFFIFLWMGGGTAVPWLIDL